MATTLLDYTKHELDSFVQRPLTRVDSLVFSCLSYLRIPESFSAARSDLGMPLAALFDLDWAEVMSQQVFSPRESLSLLLAVSVSPRFKDVRVARYVQETDADVGKQFAAMTFLLPDERAYVAFRGTDNTLVGWKEDFEMAFSSEVPSQTHARAYLEETARVLGRPLFVGGHSKGGNLATFAAMTCSDTCFASLVRVFSHDGPGFTQETLARDDWRGDTGIIDKTVPQDSLVGMLLEQQETSYQVIQSSNSGIMQHAPLSWQVQGNDFVCLSDITSSARSFNQRLNSWIWGMSPDERADFVDTIFEILNASGATTFKEMGENWTRSVNAMSAALERLPIDKRAGLEDAIDDLIYVMVGGKYPATKSENPLIQARRDVDNLTASFNEKLDRMNQLLGE